MYKLSRSIFTIALIALAFSGSATANTNDGRQALLLTPAERALVLTEMRLFLSTVQAITEGVSKENLPLIIKAARKAGVRAQPGMPASLTQKLPLNFKILGRDTHKKFDLLALDAEELGDPQLSLQQLSELMNNCISCHATYKIEIK